MPKVYNKLGSGIQETELSQEFLENLYQKLSDDSHDDVRLNRTEFNSLMKIILENIQYKMAGGMYDYSTTLDYSYNAIVTLNGQLYICIKPNGPTTDYGVHGVQSTEYWSNIAKGIMALTDEEVIGVLNRKVSALQDDVSSLNTFRTNILDYASRVKVQGAYDDIEALEATAQSHTESLENHGNSIDEINTSLAEHLQTLTTINNTLQTMRGELDDSVQRDVSIETKVNKNTDDISDHEGRISTLETASAENTETIVDHTSRLESLETNEKTYQSKVNHENDITLLTNRLNTAYDTIEQLQTELATLRADMEEGDINVRKKLYKEIVSYGEQGEYLCVDYNEALQENGISSKPLVFKMNMSYNADQLALLKLHPVSMGTIFSEWQRFAHAGRANTESNQIENSKNAWSYDKSTGEISSNINSSVYSGFISPTKHRQYYLKAKLRGNDTDNDIIGIVCAFYTDDNGVEHTLSVIRAKMIESHTLYRYGLVYDYGKTTEKIIAERNDVIKDVTGGWSGNYVIIDALRTGSRLVVKTSNINSDVLLDASEIDFTVPETKPEDWTDEMYNTIYTMLQNPMQVGFGVFSENGRFSVLEQKYIFDDNDIYDILNDQILRYVEKTSTWNIIGKCTDTLDDNILVWSPNINTLFYYAHGGVQVISTSSEWAVGKDISVSAINNTLNSLNTKNLEQDNNIQALSNMVMKPQIEEVQGSLHLEPKNAVLKCIGDTDIMIDSVPDFSEFTVYINSNGFKCTIQGIDYQNMLKVTGFAMNDTVVIDVKEF